MEDLDSDSRMKRVSWLTEMQQEARYYRRLHWLGSNLVSRPLINNNTPLYQFYHLAFVTALLLLSTTASITMATGNKAPRYGVDVSRSKEVPWFKSELGSSLTPAGRALLETYSGIPASEVEAHIYKNVSRSLTVSVSATAPH